MLNLANNLTGYFMLIYKEMNQKNEGKVNLIIAEGDIDNVFSMRSSNTKGTEDGEEEDNS